MDNYILNSMMNGLIVLGRDPETARKVAGEGYFFNRIKYPHGIPETGAALRAEYAHAERVHGAFK